MLSKKTWVLVANGALARIFQFSKGQLKELQVLTHPESKLHGRNLVSDKPGLSFSSGSFARRSMSGSQTPQQNEIEHFSREITGFLEISRRKGEFEALHLISSPAFLGLLRQNLNGDMSKLILSEVDKDLVDEVPLKIRNYLP